MHGSLSFRLPSLMPRAVPGPRPQRSGTARPRIGPAADVAVRLQSGASGREHHNGPGWHGRPARTGQRRPTSVRPPANWQFQGHPPQPRTSTFPHCVYGGVTAHRAGPSAPSELTLCCLAEGPEFSDPSVLEPGGPWMQHKRLPRGQEQVPAGGRGAAPVFRQEIQVRPDRLERLCYGERGTVEDASTDTITRSGETALGKRGGGCRRSLRPAHPARSGLRAAGMPASLRCRWKTAAVVRAAGRDA